MWIVAIAWIYVVVLMAATEPTVVGGIMTFVFYCALPLSILFYLTGARRRRARSTARPGRAAAGSYGAYSPVWDHRSDDDRDRRHGGDHDGHGHADGGGDGGGGGGGDGGGGGGGD